MRPRVFYHCYQVGPPDSCSGSWRFLFWDACIKMMASGLSEAADCNLVLVGDESERRWLTQPTTEPKPWLHRVPWLNLAAEYSQEDNAGKYELLTLKLLWDEAVAHHSASTEEYAILYWHTKGCFTQNLAVACWRELMASFLVEDYKNCVDTLLWHGADTCGVEYKPFGGWHYSGNFWWAKSSWVAQLPDPIESLKRWHGEPRMWAEYWLTHIPGKHHCLWDSGVDDLYRTPIYRKQYVYALKRPLP